MALTNQPYLPLYVDDWMNNTKLKQCSAGAHGIMIAVMCVMHKEDSYGKVLLKQKFKQGDKKILNFASFFARILSFDIDDITSGLSELIEEKILIFDGDYLVCPRMVKDASTSLSRSKSGGEGGKKTAKKFALAKGVANTGTENENEIVSEINIWTVPCEILKQDSEWWNLEVIRKTTLTPEQIDFSLMQYWLYKQKENHSGERNSLRATRAGFQKWLNDEKKFNKQTKITKTHGSENKHEHGEVKVDFEL